MKLDYLIIYVADVDVTAQFYQAAFGLTPKMVHESGEYIELDTGELTLGFAAYPLANQLIPSGYTPIMPEVLPPGIQLSFSSADVSASLQVAITHGATLVAEPEIKPWGFEVAFIRDINGVLIEICKKVA